MKDIEYFITELNKLNDFGKYEYIINCGKKVKELPVEYRNNSTKVFGCSSDLYLGYINNEFRIWSKSMFIRGLGYIVCEVANNVGRNNIKDINFSLFEKIGINLTPSRVNGISNLISKIKYFK